MKSLRIIFCLTVFLCIGCIYPSKAQSPEQQYQKGLVKEEGEGALQEAISIYNQVADNQNAEKALQAKALLHIGMCYEKMGKQEAVKAYQRLVSNFPEQKNEVTIAKERLSNLNAPGSTKEIVIRQVWTGPEAESSGSVSANGELLSFTDWLTANLAVRNLKTGENRLVTHDGTWEDPEQYTENSLISPDGKQFAYNWNYKDLYYELRYLKNDSQKPITLYSCENSGGYITPGVWFSDGARLIAWEADKTDRSWKLISIETLSGKTEILKEKVPYSGLLLLGKLSLSPDEKYLAYDFPDSAGSRNWDINLLSLSGKTETHLVEHPAYDRLIGWVPNSNEILFVSDRSDTKDLWALSAIDGKSVSVPKRVLTNIGDIDPLGFTRNGSLFFSVMTNVYESFTVPLDPGSGIISMNSKTSIPGQKFGCIWLPDGETLVCCQYSQTPEARRNREINLAALNSKTQVSKILTGRLIVWYRQLTLSPDGKSVLVYGFDKQRINEKDKRAGIFKIDIETGEFVKIITKQNAGLSLSIEWDKEGKNIFYNSSNQLIKHNIETGDEKIIYTNDNIYMPVLIRSADGNSLFFDLWSHKNLFFHLLRISGDGGKADTLCTYQNKLDPHYRRIALSPDGKYLYFSAVAPELKSILYRIPVSGGTPQNLWQSANYYISGISIHPDGKKITLSISGDENATEIRTIDNLGKKVAEIFSKND